MKPAVKNNAELKNLVLENVQSNYIWLNAFSLINPTDKIYMDIGKAVVEMLKTRENLLPHYYGERRKGKITDLQKLTPVLYMSVSAS